MHWSLYPSTGCLAHAFYQHVTLLLVWIASARMHCASRAAPDINPHNDRANYSEAACNPFNQYQASKEAAMILDD